MRRIVATFVLLCVGLFGLTGMAWADDADSFIPVHIVDHGKNEKSDPNTELGQIQTIETASNGSTINLKSTDVPAHYNGEHTLGYWVGFGVKLSSDLRAENFKYSWGWEGGSTEIKDNTSEIQSGDSNTYYATFYFGITDISKKAFLRVISGDTSTSTDHYNVSIDFSGITLSRDLEVKFESEDVSNLSIDLASEDTTLTLQVKLTKSDDKFGNEDGNSDKYVYQWYLSSADKADARSTDIGPSSTNTSTLTIKASELKTISKSGDTLYYYCVVMPHVSGGDVISASADTGVTLATITIYDSTPTPPETPGDDGGDTGSGGGSGSDANSGTDNSNSGGGGGGGSSDSSTPTTEEIQAQNSAAADNLAEKGYEQSTINDVKAALEDAGISVPVSDYDLEKFADNLEAIKEEKGSEESSGEVADTKTPAASDLPVTDAIKDINELSAAPKATEPEAPSAEEQAQIVENLTNLSDLDVAEEALEDIPADFNVEEVQQVSEETITIAPLPSSLEAQAALINSLFEAIGELLTRVTMGGNARYGVVIATTMPTMTPKTTGYFPMKMNMRHLTPGHRPRFWHSTAAFRAAASVGEATLAGSEGDAFFLDENGNPTTVISGDASKMTVVPYLLEGVPYDSAFITVDASEKDKEKLEALAANQDTDSDTSTSSSSSGCDVAGFGFGALAALAAFMRLSKKR